MIKSLKRMVALIGIIGILNCATHNIDKQSMYLFSFYEGSFGKRVKDSDFNTDKKKF